ncbi:galacturonokinase isoform X1 [Nicotiana tabacum]|uniref:Galacturonokinase isoform X1 n=2 Tax=Nicotiana TaxID=4085 RepID=A0A1S4DLS0_TOBAC|nr:PREDICTED: galacturonokinase isoform X1 [Nicotiana sylvestris]XP_009801868.1 PREDICTED: galacturonokinase isoform X2 [Nicotiana sylvestris]XP_016514354.1 PREDICTED: galacturonokinase-like isoform X1 [Nicotiana tabacum]XP_016514363.1 PREDICTED: galacturonokinase-like isoform X2 [Nicotiana tabacum]
MGVFSGHWPSESELDKLRQKVAEMSGRDAQEVRVVVSPYRICPLGAHIDHQGGTVSAMTINRGILLGFVPSNDTQVTLQSGQFKGEVRFRVDEVQLPKHISKTNGLNEQIDSSKPQEECKWGNYARGAIYALQNKGNPLKTGITGFICGSEGLDSSGLSSSAAVGIAYLLAFESANGLVVCPTENIEYDRQIENEYLGLKNGILDQSAILLSSYGCLTCMNCKISHSVENSDNYRPHVQTIKHKLIRPPEVQNNHVGELGNAYKILLAFSGLKQALTTNPGYNRRVAECQEAAKLLLQASGNEEVEPVLSNVEPEVFEAHKSKLEPDLAKRAEHYFSENERVLKGLEAWASGNLKEFGELITASGLSSIQNYECGCEPLIQLYEILLKAPGVLGARFSGAGFRGCCLAFVDADRAEEAAMFVKNEYCKLQPELASHINQGPAVLICDAGDCARVI